MEIIRSNSKLFNEYWNFFCQFECLGPMYHYFFLKLMIEMVSDNLIQDYSFIIIDDDEPLAIVPLLLEKGEYGPQFAYRDTYLPAYRYAKNISKKKKK